MSSLKQRTSIAILWNLLGTGGGEAIHLVIGIVLARILVPAEFGLMAMLNVFIGVSRVFIEGGFGAALVQKKDATRAEESSVLFCNLAMAGAFYGILWLAAPYVASFYGEPMLTRLLRFVALGLLLTAPGIVQGSLLGRQLNFKKLTKVRMIASTISGLVAIVLAKHGFGVWSLGVQMVLMAFLNSVILWLVSDWRPIFRFRWRDVQPLAAFGYKLVCSSVLGQVFSNLNSILIGKFYTTTDLGFYSRAQTLQAIPVNTFSHAISGVLLPAFVHARDDPVQCRRGYSRALTFSMAVTFPMMISLLVVAEPLIRLLLSEKWMQAVPYFRVFCLCGVWYPMHLLNLNYLLAIGRSDLYLKLEIRKKFVSLAITAVMLPFGVMALAWGLLLSSIVCLYINTLYTGRLAGYGLLDQLADVLPYGVIYAITGIVVWIIIPVLPAIDFLRLFAVGVIFICSFLGITFLKKGNIYRYGFAIIMAMFRRPNVQ